MILRNVFATSLFDLVMLDKRKRVIYSIENKYRNTRKNIEAKRRHSVRFRPYCGVAGMGDDGDGIILEVVISSGN